MASCTDLDYRSTYLLETFPVASWKGARRASVYCSKPWKSPMTAQAWLDAQMGIVTVGIYASNQPSHSLDTDLEKIQMPCPSIQVQLNLIYGLIGRAIQLSDLTSSRIARSDLTMAQVHRYYHPGQGAITMVR